MGGEPFKRLSTAVLKISTVPRSDQYGAEALSQARQMPRSLCQQSFSCGSNHGTYPIHPADWLL